MKIFKVSVFLCSLILPCITVTQIDDRCDEYEVNVSGETEHRDVFRRVKREFVPYKTGKLVARQVSNALDHLLFFSGYDKRIRPQLGGPPIPVVVNLSIRSMGPVDENRQAFNLDCYFRQSWVDKRLQYNATGVTELALNWAFLPKIWVPDTFFINGKKSYLHKITVPNRFVRISPNGRVSYSQRLTIAASCSMDLHKFPLDSQVCPLHIGSFGYSAEDIIYKWAKPNAVSIDEVGMAQFLLKEYRSFETIAVSNRRTKFSFRNDSVASLEFLFERQTGFFLLQIYTPLTLIVICSWVAFWIPGFKAGEVAGRTALGATSVLSVVNIGFGGKSRPQVGYATAMDTFIMICFVAVFAALFEFACTNFLDTYFQRLRDKHAAAKKAKEEADAKREELEKALLTPASLPIAIVTLTSEDEAKEQPQNQKIDSRNPFVRVRESQENEGTQERVVLVTIESQNSKPEITFTPIPPLAEIENGGDEERDFEDVPQGEEDDDYEGKAGKTFFQTLSEFLSTFGQKMSDKIENFVESRYGPITEMYVYKNTKDVVWTIDDRSRKIFPLVFLFLQIIYWTSYLYIM